MNMFPKVKRTFRIYLLVACCTIMGQSFGIEINGMKWVLAPETMTVDSASNSFTIINKDPNKVWSQCMRLANGQLLSNQTYQVSFDYAFSGHSSPANFGFVLLRHETISESGDQWKRFSEVDGISGTITFNFHTTYFADPIIILGLSATGTLTFTNPKIVAVDKSEYIKSTQIPHDPPNPPVIGSPEFEILLPSPVDTGDIAYFSNFTDSEISNEQAFINALTHCREHQLSKLIIEPGTYAFQSGIPLYIENFQNFTIEAYDVIFLFSGNERRQAFQKDPQALIFRNNSRIRLAGLTVDWDQKDASIASLITVKSINADNSLTAEFAMGKPTDFSLSKFNALLWVPVESTPPFHYTYGPEVGPIVKSVTAVEGKPDQLRIYLDNAYHKVNENQTYIVSHFNYQWHCFLFDSNQHMTVEDVNITKFPGSGYQITGHQKYWQLIRCNIGNNSDSTFPVSTAVDGIHFRQSNGFFKMIDCRIKQCGDDGLNLHDNISAGVKIVSERELIAYNVEPWKNPFKQGDLIELWSPSLEPNIFSSILTEAHFEPGKTCRLRFADPIPTGISSRSVVVNRAYNSSNFIIDGCEFSLNRARGILVQAGNGTIRNSLFRRNQSAAIRVQLDIEDRWAEGIGVDNLSVYNNTFDAPNALGWAAGAAIRLEAIFPGNEPGTNRIKNISISDNQFNGVFGPAIWGTGTDNLSAEGNTVDAPCNKNTNGPYHSTGAFINDTNSL